MARRASSSLDPKWIIGIILLVVIAIAGGKFIFKDVGDPYRTIPELETAAYLENSNSLRGNVYKISGTIANSLAYSATDGRLFSLEVSEQGTLHVLPVLVPARFNHINIQRGQQFLMQIEVGEKGILTVIDLTKA